MPIPNNQQQHQEGRVHLSRCIVNILSRRLFVGERRRWWKPLNISIDSLLSSLVLQHGSSCRFMIYLFLNMCVCVCDVFFSCFYAHTPRTQIFNKEISKMWNVKPWTIACFFIIADITIVHHRQPSSSLFMETFLFTIKKINTNYSWFKRIISHITPKHITVLIIHHHF